MLVTSVARPPNLRTSSTSSSSRCVSRQHGASLHLGGHGLAQEVEERRCDVLMIALGARPVGTSFARTTSLRARGSRRRGPCRSRRRARSRFRPGRRSARGGRRSRPSGLDDAVPFLVELLGPVGDRADGAPLLVAERLELRLELVADALVVLGRDGALGLAARDVQEEPAVVAPLAPRDRALDQSTMSGRERRGLGRLSLSVEVALVARATRSRRCRRRSAWRRGRRRRAPRCPRRHREQPTDLLVEPPVVRDRVLVRLPGS